MSEQAIAGKKVDPKFRRNMMIVGGALALAIVGMFVAVLSKGSGQAEVAGGQAVLPSAGANGAEVKRAATPAEQQLLAKKQALEAAEAQQKRESYIPPDSGPAVPVGGAAPAAGHTQGVEGTYVNGGPYGQQGQPAQGAYAAAPAPTQADLEAAEAARAAADRMRSGANMQTKAIVAMSAPMGGHSRVSIAGGGAGAGAGGPALQISSASLDAGRDGREIAGVPGSGRGYAAAGSAGGVVVADALEIFGAVLSSPIDTYKTGYVSAKVVSGPLAGAFLVGTTTLVNEGLQPKFTQMRHNGQTYKIDAIALDEATATNAVSANLDRRILQRYVLPVAMAAVGGAAGALAQPAQSAVGMQGGNTAVVTAQATREQAVAAGVSSAMTLGQRAIDADAQLPIRATLPAGTPIGVMMIAPVLSTDASAASQAAAAGAFARDRAESNAANSTSGRPGLMASPQMMPGMGQIPATAGIGRP